MMHERNTGFAPEPLSIRKAPEARKPRRASRTPGYKATYHSWYAMLRRCSNPADPAWRNYGGRGITACDRWLASFQNFLADMGEKPPGMSLDRIDNEAGYSPGNCRWATPRQQARNTRSFRMTSERVREIIRLDEAGVSITEISHLAGVSVKAARMVLAVAAALSEPHD